jgi:hypothetical protein
MGGPAPVPYESPELLQQVAQLNDELATETAAKETCSTELSTVQANLSAKSTALDACTADLSTVQADLVKCQANLGKYGLPDTGQTKCYDAAGNIIACNSTAYPGLDGFYNSGCPTDGRFVDNKDGTVTDTCTGLMWQKNTANTNGDGKIDANDVLTWQTALEYCETLNFASHRDWRLPNVREFQSIVDYGRFNPSIDPVFGAVSDWYVSSSSSIGYPGYAWIVHFGDGGVGSRGDKGNRGFVRAVRLGP